ncbi:MAG: hypothetical protein AAF533_18675 [Acidobacteriota bacterium]
MTQTHLSPRDLPRGDGSDDAVGRALWAVEPDGRLVVFVHGFGGSSTSTWVQFPSLFPQRDECGNADALFYEYDSLRTQTLLNGNLLFQFLDRLLSGPAALANSTLAPEVQRPDGFRYDRVVLAAHSLGAVVARQALMAAHRSESEWLSRTRLVLFAPAHRGARVQALAMSALTGIPWLSGLLNSASYFYPPLAELEPDSDLLRELQDDTEAAVAAGTGDRLLASQVVHGAKDKVVRALPFSQDPVALVVPDRDHVDVCKPCPDFATPLDAVVEQLR